MIYVTGDTHGDLEGFKKRNLRQLKKGDTLIVCGDFGFLWDNSKTEQKAIQWIGKQKFNTLFIHGTHDNLDIINSYPEIDYMEGRARQIFKNLYALSNGHVFTIEDKKVFVHGGGESDDIDTRMSLGTWWEGEMPSEEEISDTITRLSHLENKVDYIITHQAYPKIESGLLAKNASENTFNDLLKYISENIQFKKWFFGKYHIDKIIPTRYIAVFNQIAKAE